VIAIDGPAGAGKSAAARLLAERLHLTYIDTGALYRSVALAARRQGIDLDDEPALGRLSRELHIAFEAAADGGQRVIMEGEDVTKAIRTPVVSEGSSRVSRHPAVRRALLDVQRRLAKGGGAVMEGRDIGTVVLPDADLKVFLTASAEARAQRRHKELLEKGVSVTLEQVLEEQKKRDERDRSRPASPLKPADDAVILDTSELSLEQVLEALVRLANS